MLIFKRRGTLRVEDEDTAKETHSPENIGKCGDTRRRTTNRTNCTTRSQANRAHVDHPNVELQVAPCSGDKFLVVLRAKIISESFRPLLQLLQ